MIIRWTLTLGALTNNFQGWQSSGSKRLILSRSSSSLKIALWEATLVLLPPVGRSSALSGLGHVINWKFGGLRGPGVCAIDVRASDGTYFPLDDRQSVTTGKCLLTSTSLGDLTVIDHVAVPVGYSPSWTRYNSATGFALYFMMTDRQMHVGRGQAITVVNTTGISCFLSALQAEAALDSDALPGGTTLDFRETCGSLTYIPERNNDL
ncbi:hypothetical protein R1flu_024627 [Riccia fluitans]|uniref:Uncharacterized protein n=1 Tax=Riccia fluitans TaxID=41844 RepID=A0ABD1XVE9_9MARC